MKQSLVLLLSAALGLGALPSSADAATVVVSTGSSYHQGYRGHGRYHGHHRHSRREYHRAHWEVRHGHRVFIPARTVTVYF